jgi:hypothetical protein
MNDDKVGVLGENPSPAYQAAIAMGNVSLGVQSA